MIQRQKILLHFLHLAGGKASRLQLVKWLFLLAQESRAATSAAHYQFVPYKFGPFSFTLYQELEALIRDAELTAPTENELQAAKPRFAAPPIGEPALELEIDRCWQRYGHLGTTALLDTVYARYPWFTMNSDQKERRAVKRPVVKPAVFTAGYEGLQVDGFLNLLLQSGIQRLVDVRNNPVSRRYGFHKSTLAKLCDRLGIEYRHEPEVGIPSAWRTELDTQADYDRLFDRYERDILPAQPDAIGRIAALVKAAPSVLVCQECEPRCCHRTRLAKRVADATGLPIRDLRSGQ